MIKCSRCKSVFPATEEYFYRKTSSTTGWDYWCKNCRKIIDSKHSRTPEYRAKKKLFRVAHRESENARGLRRKATEKVKKPNAVSARDKLGRAVRDGKITKCPCVVCGNSRSHGHHSDYTKPLEVIWLCALHHREEHERLKAVGHNFNFGGRYAASSFVLSGGDIGISPNS